MFRILLALSTLVGATVPAAATEAPRVGFHTSLGDIVIEVEPDRAPRTVENFLDYVRRGIYDGTIFHRVIPGFVIQGGGFSRNFDRMPTEPPIPNEADNGLVNARGTLSMARTSDPHSATSQFFINLADNVQLDHRDKTLAGWGYAVFARVVEGLDVVDRIAAVRTGPRGPYRDVPTTPVVLESAEILKPKQSE